MPLPDFVEEVSLPDFALLALVPPPDVVVFFPFSFFLSALLLPEVLPVALSALPPEIVLVVLVVPPASAEDGASEFGATLSAQVKITKSATYARVIFMIIPP